MSKEPTPVLPLFITRGAIIVGWSLLYNTYYLVIYNFIKSNTYISTKNTVVMANKSLQLKEEINQLRKRLTEDDLRWSTEEMIIARIKFKKQQLNELYYKYNK